MFVEPVPAEPMIGDAFGELMREALAEQRGHGLMSTIGGTIPRYVTEIVERDDGMISAAPAARYLCGPDQWPDFDLRALDQIAGRTLDIGTGAGRLALAVQERGEPVVGLDTSPGAVEVAAARGVRATVCTTVAQHAGDVGRSYDCFALFGANLALLESRQRAPLFLGALAALARPGARIVAQGVDPYQTDNELHLAYHARNRSNGRMGGQLRLRVRHHHLATAWFDYLHCAPDELAELVAPTAWRITDVDQISAPFYLATLRLTSTI